MTIAQRQYVEDIDKAYANGKNIGHHEVALVVGKALDIARDAAREVEALVTERDEPLASLHSIVAHLRGWESWGTVAMGAIVIAEDAISRNRSFRTRPGIVPSVRVADQWVPVHEVTQSEARDKAAQAGVSGSPLSGGGE